MIKEINWFQWIQILGPTIFIIIGGIISWIIKSRYEKLIVIEGKLRTERRDIYIHILEPYFTLFSGEEENKISNALKQITSAKYKKIAFELCLFGSDNVVNAYNNLIQLGYESEKSGERDDKKMIKLFGNFLLEIRKSLGNKKTKLNEADMLQVMIKDIKQII